MPETKPTISKNEINRAGDTLISADSESEDYTHALEAVQRWRYSHEIPLNEITDDLRNRAMAIDQTSLVVSRPKRIPSIQSKLARLKNTRLARMQDIGGCRAIMKTVNDVYALSKVYESAVSSDESSRIRLVKVFDRILQPKPDGYRCLHLIFNHQTVNHEDGSINEHTIEMQIRTQLQHHWATAVETAATFLARDLKAGVGDARWLRFFALASSVFAIIEGCEMVPETTKKQIDLISEIRSLWYELQVDVCFEGWLLVANQIGEDDTTTYFLIIADSRNRTLNVQGFALEENEIAIEALNNAELEYAQRPEIQVAKVSVDDVSKLKEAYPNYYAETRGFIDELTAHIEPEYERKVAPEERADKDKRPDDDFRDYKR